MSTLKKFEVTIQVPEDNLMVPPYRNAIREVKEITGLQAMPKDSHGGPAVAPFWVTCSATTSQICQLVERKWPEWKFIITGLGPTPAQ